MALEEGLSQAYRMNKEKKTLDPAMLMVDYWKHDHIKGFTPKLTRAKSSSINLKPQEGEKYEEKIKEMKKVLVKIN